MDSGEAGSAADGATDPIAMLSDALARMPYGVSAWSPDHRLLYWNEAYRRLYDIAPGQIFKGMTLRQRCALALHGSSDPSVGLEALVASHRRRLGGSSDPSRPAVHLDRVGGRVIERTYLPSSGGGWVVIHEDETAQVEREEDIKAQHDRLDLALGSMDYGFCLFDSGLRLVVWNERLIDLYRLERSGIVVGATLLDVLSASVAAGNHRGWSATELDRRERERLAGVLPGESIQSEAVAGDGRVVRIRWKRTDGGWWVVTHEDITAERDRLQALERREAELALQNMRFAAAVDHMTQGLCMFDSRHALIICNQRYMRLYDLPPHLAAPGAKLADIWRHIGFEPPGGPDAYIAARLESLSSGEVSETIELADGRMVSIIHRPLAGGWVATHEDVTEQRRSEARIRFLARHDELTGLPNRVHFRERMGEVEASFAKGEMVGVLFIDLDHFKAVNDLYGHATGDGVLVQVAQRLLAACSDTDTVARLGGDEFAVLRPSLASPQDAAALAERIVGMVSVPIQINGYEVILGASIGIAVAPGDGRDAETLMKNADLAAYRAKADGRGAFHFFEPALDAALQERRSFEMELRGALLRNELSLVFQPLVNLDDNRISSVEALLRWNHSTRGLVLPDRLIPAAERSGLIGPIGEWVLRESCLTAATWPKDVTVSVNVSPIQFGHGQLARQVEDALRLSGLEPARLHIEVTETALLVDNASTLTTLAALRRLGVLISLDDFGTGYSSLGYLRTFRFDRIKIDRSFVHDLSGDTSGLAITKAIIALGRNLGIATAAEGVETEAQFEFVRSQGCTEVQGYIFSPPVPASAIARVLADERDDGAMPVGRWRPGAGSGYSGSPAVRRPPM